MEKHRFKTAEFAALCGVKKDTLLHYDHIGLLKPQWVGENGYRYYSARQIPTYDLIATLRRLGTPLAEIRSYLTRRSPEALMDLLREKEADWEAERRRLARMGAFLHNAKDKMALAQTVRPGEIRLETFPEAHCAVVEAPDFAHAKFEEAVYLLHVRQLITWARENGTTGWPLRVRPAGTYAVLYHQGSYASEYGACRRLRDWVLAQGYAIDGDLYEEDLVNDIASEDPRSYLLKLSLKIQTP